MKKSQIMFAVGAAVLLSASPVRSQLFISEYLANPPGTDSPYEYVELIATENIDFAQTPFSVVFANNGAPTTAGWIAGSSITYGFSITAGAVARGDVVYVGGSSMAPTGPKLRTLNTYTTAGDGFGDPAAGVLGNGGGSADGIAVFNVGIGALTPSTAPVDAVFFGTSLGGAVVNSGADGYQLPVNDLYAGGKLQTTSFITIDPPSGSNTVASGVYDYTTDSWLTPRAFSLTATLSDNASSITLVPEPHVALLWLGLGLIAVFLFRRHSVN